MERGYSKYIYLQPGTGSAGLSISEWFTCHTSARCGFCWFGLHDEEEYTFLGVTLVILIHRYLGCSQVPCDIMVNENLADSLAR